METLKKQVSKKSKFILFKNKVSYAKLETQNIDVISENIADKLHKLIKKNVC